MYTLEQFKKDVIQWSTDRLIIQNGTVKGQLNKLTEELEETKQGLYRESYAEIMDGIGDCAVVLINLDALQGSKTEFSSEQFKYVNEIEQANAIKTLDDIEFIARHTKEDYKISWDKLVSFASMVDVDFMECCELAWNEIKDRKGYFCDKTKTFIKDIEGEVVSGTVLIEAKAVTE